jgi:hypothetical protein
MIMSISSPERAPVPQNRTRLSIFAGALMAGLIAFGVGESIYKIIPAKKVLQSVMMTSAKVLLPTPATETVAAARNGALAFGVLGLCLSSGLGIAGGLARQSAAAATRAGLLGAIVGAIVGAGLSLALLPMFLALQNRYPDDELSVLLLSLVMHAIIWGLVGASAGLAFTVGLGEPSLRIRAAIAGFWGAVLGTVVFELAGGLFFPLAATHQPISETWPTRLLARLLVTLGTVSAMIVALPKSEHKTAA